VISKALEKGKRDSQQGDDGEKSGIHKSGCPHHQAVLLKSSSNMENDLNLFDQEHFEGRKFTEIEPPDIFENKLAQG